MANKIVLDVELKSKIQQAQEIYGKIDKGKGFAGPTGKEAQAKFQGNWEIIARLLKQTELSEEEFKQLNTAIKNVFSVLNTYASKIESLSEKAIALQKKVDKQLETRNKAEEDRNTQKEKVSNKKVDLINAIGDKEIHAITKSGKLHGGGALTAETVAAKLAKGEKIGYKDELGNIQEVKADSSIAKMAQEYLEAQAKLTQFEQALTEANNKLDELTEKLKRQIETDRATNPSGGASLVTETMDAEKEVRQGLSKTKEEILNQKDRQKETEAIQANTKAHQENNSVLGRAFKQFTIYSIALRTVKRALREAVDTVRELDKELTEQAMVTGLTRQEVYRLVKSYQELATQTCATTKQVASVATEYMKQGKSINDALVLTEAAVSAAKVARVSVGDSVNYLTTALNGFQLAAKDAMKVSDKFAAVAAASATDYDELAIALSKVASQANLAGMSIDYTTALLTKGLETTREAPETMGTALKTIIARMRELGDYGETLEGDTDINNVETQLAYVDIALRNTKGELRSTEDVLDELGQKWDTLNKNQQAAVAKALAGTRQQSRLIAMMTDYERVIELQQIAQRSAWATAAQAGVYLEGMEAAINNTTVAWESLVTSVSDSEVIISMINALSVVLEKVGNFLDTDFGAIAALTIAVSLSAALVGNKMREVHLSRLNSQYILQNNLWENETMLTQQKKLVAEKKVKNEKLSGLIATKKELIAQKQTTLEKLKQAKAEADEKGDALKAAEYAKQITETENELTTERRRLKELEANYDKLAYGASVKKLDMLSLQNQTLVSQKNLWSNIVSGIYSLILPLQIVFLLSKKINHEKMKEYAATLRQQAADAKGLKKALLNAGARMAESAGKIPYVGWAIGIAILAALGIGIAVAIGQINKYNNATDASAEKVNELSNEIYKLEEKANAINKITSSFNDLDNKIIKTKKDIEEMNELLDSAADSLSSETYDSKKEAEKAGETWFGEGVSEQDYYKTLSDKQKIRYLNNAEKEARDKADEYRDQQLAEFNKLSGSQLEEMLNEDTANANYRKAQSALYAINNDNLYEYIDLLKETTNWTDNEAAAVEELTENLLEELSTRKALDYANDPEKVKALVQSVKDLKTSIDNEDGETSQVSTSKILTSDDYGITEKAAAFKTLAQQFGTASEEYELLSSAYSEYEVFAEMRQDVLEMIDYLEISIDDINKLNDAYETLAEEGLKMTQAEYKDLITSENGILATLAHTGGDIKSTIKNVFGAALSAADNYEQTYKQLVKTFDDLLGQGSLNMGQNITKLENRINSFYEKASDWNNLSEAEKTEFMADNSKLFEENPELLNYIETNQWDKIAAALQDSQALSDEINQNLKYIETELEIQKALGDEADQNYVKWLNDRKAELLDSTNLFRADLELLIEQQQEQLNIYRDYLEKQQEQLEESLEKRKEAYEDYFEAINQQQEDEDYQEQSDLLVANLSKLASSTDAAANKQRAQLEQQLEDLEEERQQTLRERAQEAVIENLDREVEEINDKFDKLLENEQLLLKAMQGDISLSGEDAFLGKILATAREGGMTDLQLEDFTNQLSAAFGSTMDVSDINEVMETIQNNATINIGDQTFDLNTEDGDVVWQTLLAMLTKYGYGR